MSQSESYKLTAYIDSNTERLSAQKRIDWLKTQLAVKEIRETIIVKAGYDSKLPEGRWYNERLHLEIHE